MSAISRGLRPRTASGHRGNDVDNHVFVQTNELEGNRIVVFERQVDGRLDRQGTYATGGRGGNAAPGTESDRLASQGSLVYDAGHRLLLAVNAGSDSISVFRVRGERLRLSDIDSSGGDFPASIAVYGDLVYVLNSVNDGRLQGFRIHGFQLLVTTKASKSTIDIFDVESDGRLLRTPVSNPSATPVPFAFTFDADGSSPAKRERAPSRPTWSSVTAACPGLSRSATGRSRSAGSSVRGARRLPRSAQRLHRFRVRHDERRVLLQQRPVAPAERRVVLRR